MHLMSGPVYGVLERIAPGIRRMLAPNPSLFTHTGTHIYVVGEGDVAVIDPGPDDPGHLGALLAALGTEPVRAILCTHTHRDHSPGAGRLRAMTGAPIVGCAPLIVADDGVRADASFDDAYAPDQVLADGEQLRGASWTLQAVATPGHAPNHLCFRFLEEEALFSGDHVMGWSTTIVAPPEGDMAAYMKSLEKLLEHADAVYYPAHGQPIADPHAHVHALIAHRRDRERQIVDALGDGPHDIAVLVASLYRGIDPGLHPAAAMSVLAHLLDLEARGLVVRSGKRWRLA